MGIEPLTFHISKLWNKGEDPGLKGPSGGHFLEEISKKTKCICRGVRETGLSVCVVNYGTGNEWFYDPGDDLMCPLGSNSCSFLKRKPHVGTQMYPCDSKDAAPQKEAVPGSIH